MLKSYRRVCFWFMLIIAFAGFLTGCATTPQISRPDKLIAPKPIMGNSGQYMCPYTQDGVMAEWTDKAINAKIGSKLGQTAGTYAGQKALDKVPFVGGYIGSKGGEIVGRKLAIESAGGMDYIKKKSDLSFNDIEKMSVYLYVKHSNHPHYQDALDAAMEIYPELKEQYYPALQKASSR